MAEDLPLLPLDFGKRMARMGALLDQVVVRPLSAHGLSRAEFDVLIALQAAGEPHKLRPSDLASRLLLTSGGTSNILRRLEERNLLRRTPGPADGRSRDVELTDQGLRLAIDAGEDLTRALSRFLAPIPEDLVRHLADDLREALAAVGDHAATGPTGQLVSPAVR